MKSVFASTKNVKNTNEQYEEHIQTLEKVRAMNGTDTQCSPLSKGNGKGQTRVSGPTKDDSSVNVEKYARKIQTGKVEKREHADRNDEFSFAPQ